MSKISLSPNASGTATFTIAAPGTNTDRTLTLPDNSGTVQTQLDQGFSFRNRIINGGMGIWQRGTTFSASGYVQDRWILFAPSGSVSASRSTDVPSGFQFSAEMTGTNVSFTQRIELANCFDLVGGSVTVSFWAKNVSGTQDLFVALQNPTAADNWTSLTEITSAQVSASPSTNWTYYTVTFNGLPAGVANGLSCVIGRGAGGSTTTRITGVQLEAGSVATPFERRPYGTELQLCERYFMKSFGTYTPIANGWSTGSTTSEVQCVFRQNMRAAPTAVFSDMVVTDGVAYNLGITSYTNYISAWGARFFLTHQAGATAFRPCVASSANANGFASFSAEL